MKTLIAMLALLAMLTGCGCTNTATTPNDTGNNGTTNGTTNGTDNGTANNAGTTDGTLGDNVEQDLNDAGNAVANGAKDVGDAVTGQNDRSNTNNTTDKGTGVTTENNTVVP